MSTSSTPTAGPTWRQAIEAELLDASLDQDLSMRVSALELALCSRRARRRLIRQIRRGQRDFAWAGPDPVWVRAEAVNNAWLVREAGPVRSAA
jgi:hypothetical protein